jgi:hypothetical protein
MKQENLRGPVKYSHFMVLENDGDSDITNADWKWPGEEPRRVRVREKRFPLDRMPPGTVVRLTADIVAVGDTSGDEVLTLWTDEQGKSHELMWPLSWS